MANLLLRIVWFCGGLFYLIESQLVLWRHYQPAQDHVTFAALIGAAVGLLLLAAGALEPKK